MQAHSTKTGTDYPSWEDLVSAEANGYSVVSILRRVHPRTGKVSTFARTVGPLPDKRAAQRKAASLRRQWTRALYAGNQGTELVSVTVEPLWNELF